MLIMLNTLDREFFFPVLLNICIFTGTDCFTQVIHRFYCMFRPKDKMIIILLCSNNCLSWTLYRQEIRVYIV